MRRFSRMTKEMRPSHRIDVLTDAFIYCATKAAANLGRFLKIITTYYTVVKIYYKFCTLLKSKTTS